MDCHFESFSFQYCTLLGRVGAPDTVLYQGVLLLPRLFSESTTARTPCARCAPTGAHLQRHRCLPRPRKVGGTHCTCTVLYEVLHQVIESLSRAGIPPNPSLAYPQHHNDCSDVLRNRAGSASKRPLNLSGPEHPSLKLPLRLSGPSQSSSISRAAKTFALPPLARSLSWAPSGDIASSPANGDGGRWCARSTTYACPRRDGGSLSAAGRGVDEEQSAHLVRAGWACTSHTHTPCSEKKIQHRGEVLLVGQRGCRITHTAGGDRAAHIQPHEYFRARNHRQCTISKEGGELPRSHVRHSYVPSAACHEGPASTSLPLSPKKPRGFMDNTMRPLTTGERRPRVSAAAEPPPPPPKQPCPPPIAASRCMTAACPHQAIVSQRPG